MSSAGDMKSSPFGHHLVICSLFLLEGVQCTFRQLPALTYFLVFLFCKIRSAEMESFQTDNEAQADLTVVACHGD